MPRATASSPQAEHAAPEQENRHGLGNRLHVHGIVFRVRGCVFPNPGLYWVEFRHESVALGREPLLVR